MSKKIAIGSDHAGYHLKVKLIDYLKNKGYGVIDKGCFSEERADYPDFGHAVAEAIINKELIRRFFSLYTCVKVKSY